MRRFHLVHRDPDDDTVAELVGQGVTFPDGTSVVQWANVSIEVTHQEPDNIAHGENLDAVWLDHPPPQTVTRPLRILGRNEAT